MRNYRARVSGPLLDRIDLHIDVPAVPRELLFGRGPRDEESSAAVRERVQTARLRQQARSGRANHALTNKQIEELCRLDAACEGLLQEAISRLGLSARAYHRILKVALTISDLAGSDAILPAHVAEAVQYRSLDRSAVN